MRSLPVFADLRGFLAHMAAAGDLARISEPVDLQHEMTAVQLAALRARGPVLRFDAARQGGKAAAMPVIANLFGTPERVAAGLGLTLDQVPAFGEFLAALRSPVDAFFVGVLVNSDVPAERDNRLRLLQQVQSAMGRVADFSLVTG